MDRRYESMIIVRPDIGEEEKEALFTKISEKIKELGGKVLDSKIWARRENFVILCGQEVQKRRSTIRAFIGW